MLRVIARVYKHPWMNIDLNALNANAHVNLLLDERQTYLESTEPVQISRMRRRFLASCQRAKNVIGFIALVSIRYSLHSSAFRNVPTIIL